MNAVSTNNFVGSKKWFNQSIESLNRDPSLTAKNIKRIVADRIAEYVTGTIGILELLDFSYALRDCKAKLASDLEEISKNLLEIENCKTDKRSIHQILIIVLRKVTKA